MQSHLKLSMSLATRREALIGGAASVLVAALAGKSRAATQDTAASFDAMGTELGVVALVVCHGGETRHVFGDPSRPVIVHSMRKSMISLMFGQAVDKGFIDISTTLADLGMDDDVPLTESEKSTTIANILSARSGVYLPITASPPPGVTAPERPARGQYAPGTHWLYNNWDFNILGAIYERLTHKDFFVAFDHDIAQPLGFQDFDPYRDGNYWYVADAIGGNTRYPNFRMALSARDQAKVGNMVLAGGRAGGAQIVSAEWLAKSTQSYSETGQSGVMAGYGYLWWRGSLQTPTGEVVVISAAGANGHFIGIVPGRDLVLVVQPDTEGPVVKPVNRQAYEALLQNALALTAV